MLDMEADLQVENDRSSEMIGGTFRELKCEGCDSLLGRSYFSTPSHQDHIRDAFTLNCEHIVSYKVGSCKKVSSKDEKHQNGPVISLVGIDARKALLMNEQIVMVQKCMIDLATQVRKIERAFSSGHVPDKRQMHQEKEEEVVISKRSVNKRKRNVEDEEYVPPGESLSEKAATTTTTTTKNTVSFQLKQVPQKKKRKSRLKKGTQGKGKNNRKRWTNERLLSLKRGVEKYGPKFDLIYNDPEFGLGSFSSAKVVKAAYYYHVYQGGGKNKRKNVIHENTNGKNKEGRPSKQLKENNDSNSKKKVTMEF